MQVQIKKQLKIELDEQDITLAVANYLAANGYSINQEDLTKINYVKSPKDGLRAELNITEESGIEPEPAKLSVVQDSEGVVTGYGLENQVAEPVTISAIKAEVTPVNAVVTHEPVTEEPGEVEPSTVEDVMPGVTEIKQMVEGGEDAEPTAEAPRTKLFM